MRHLHAITAWATASALAVSLNISTAAAFEFAEGRILVKPDRPDEKRLGKILKKAGLSKKRKLRGSKSASSRPPRAKSRR